MARGLGFAEQTRRDMLKRRDKVRAGRGKIAPTPKPVRDRNKTLAMHLLEQLHGKTIEELIGTGEVRDVGKALGIDYSTISRWRERLGLRE
ncbi:hypothetical protein LCGC14_2612060 [marine sediment metagenome]|uniref:Uncharacterized protein n=1 Tax=marine sediment metagenome TaxID=412755 RepID=A0A0F9AT90_9ZZZZ